MKRVTLLIILCSHSLVHCQTQITVLESAWEGLSEDERAAIQREYLISPVKSDQVGIIFDNQGIDNSTPGNNSGTHLGSAIASATYIDNALRPNNNYSAKNHLVASILGGVLGSTFNIAPTNEYHYRYAIKGTSGDVRYYDSVSQSPFRHPIGVCVILPLVTLSPNQDLCSQTADSLKEKYLKHYVRASSNSTIASPSSSKREVGETPVISPSNSNERVLCKIAQLAPVPTSLEKCNLVNGEIIK